MSLLHQINSDMPSHHERNRQYRHVPKCGDSVVFGCRVPVTNGTMEKQRNIHVSTNYYYGFKPSNKDQSESCDEEMETKDIDMTPVDSRNGLMLQQPRTKRAYDDDSNYIFSRQKRFRTEDPTSVPQPVCYTRPTHNNPDISRCLMAHMI